MTKLAYIGFAAALATITCAAGTGEMGGMKMKGGGMGMMDMKMMDTNKDGMISENEHMKMFTTMDKNKDGMLDTGEQKMMMMPEEE